MPSGARDESPAVGDKLHGSICDAVRPREPCQLDLAWMPPHLDYLRTHGCDGIVPCGTMAKRRSLSVAERMRVVKRPAPRPMGRGWFGTGAGRVGCVALTRHAFAAGVDAVLVPAAVLLQATFRCGAGRVVSAFVRRRRAAGRAGDVLSHSPAQRDPDQQRSAGDPVRQPRRSDLRREGLDRRPGRVAAFSHEFPPAGLLRRQ